MCNFPASPSTPSADKCCVIPSGNFRAKKPNWKSIHFESGPPINTSRASIWLNSHFSTFSTVALDIQAKIAVTSQKGNCGHKALLQRGILHIVFFLPGRQLHYLALFLSLRQESGFIFPVHTIDPPLIRMSKCGLPSPYQWHTDTANYAQPRFQPCSPIIPISLNAIKLSSVSTPQTMFSFLDSSLNCSTREATYLFCVDLFSGYLLFVGFM